MPEWTPHLTSDHISSITRFTRLEMRARANFELDQFMGATSSLALVRPDIKDFIIKKKSQQEITEETELFKSAVSQTDMFDKRVLDPIQPCPYKFQYRYYVTEKGTRYKRKGTCQDWEIQATFRKWQRLYGEQKALAYIKQKFGEEYPEKGMLFAMGTHSRYTDKWLINGVIRMNEFDQLNLPF